MSWRLMPQLSVSCGIIQLKKCSAAANIILTRLGCYYAILGWGWCWGWVEPDIEAKVDLRLKLSWGWHRDWGWGWDEVGLKFSWSWIEVELRVSRVIVKNIFKVYSYCRTTFVFYVSFNFCFWFWLNLSVFWLFVVQMGYFFGLG